MPIFGKSTLRFGWRWWLCLWKASVDPASSFMQWFYNPVFPTAFLAIRTVLPTSFACRRSACWIVAMVDVVSAGALCTAQHTHFCFLSAPFRCNPAGCTCGRGACWIINLELFGVSAARTCFAWLFHRFFRPLCCGSCWPEIVFCCMLSNVCLS